MTTSILISFSVKLNHLPKVGPILKQAPPAVVFGNDVTRLSKIWSMNELMKRASATDVVHTARLSGDAFLAAADWLRATLFHLRESFGATIIDSGGLVIPEAEWDRADKHDRAFEEAEEEDRARKRQKQFHPLAAAAAASSSSSSSTAELPSALDILKGNDNAYWEEKLPEAEARYVKANIELVEFMDRENNEATLAQTLTAVQFEDKVRGFAMRATSWLAAERAMLKWWATPGSARTERVSGLYRNGHRETKGRLQAMVLGAASGDWKGVEVDVVRDKEALQRIGHALAHISKAVLDTPAEAAMGLQIEMDTSRDEALAREIERNWDSRPSTPAAAAAAAAEEEKPEEEEVKVALEELTRDASYLLRAGRRSPPKITDEKDRLARMVKNVKTVVAAGVDDETSAALIDARRDFVTLYTDLLVAAMDGDEFTDATALLDRLSEIMAPLHGDDDDNA